MTFITASLVTNRRCCSSRMPALPAFQLRSRPKARSRNTESEHIAYRDRRGRGLNEAAFSLSGGNDDFTQPRALFSLFSAAQSNVQSLMRDQQAAIEAHARGWLNKFLHPVIMNLKSDYPPEGNTVSELPSVPITLEGSSVLHQMFRFDWESWKKLSAEDEREVEAEARELFQGWEKG